MKRYIKLGVIIVVTWISGGILQTSDLPFWRDIVGSTLLWGSGAAFALVLIRPTTEAVCNHSFTGTICGQCAENARFYNLNQPSTDNGEGK